MKYPIGADVTVKAGVVDMEEFSAFVIGYSPEKQTYTVVDQNSILLEITEDEIEEG